LKMQPHFFHQAAGLRANYPPPPWNELSSLEGQAVLAKVRFVFKRSPDDGASTVFIPTGIQDQDF
jgi:hypothetical protein